MTREKRIPFEVSVDTFYSESNMNCLKRSLKKLNQERQRLWNMG